MYMHAQTILANYCKRSHYVWIVTPGAQLCKMSITGKGKETDTLHVIEEPTAHFSVKINQCQRTLKAPKKCL